VFCCCLFNILFDGGGFDAHVLAEFVEGDGLVLVFVEVLFDGTHNISALAFAFTGDLLDVFGVDAYSVHGLLGLDLLFSSFFFGFFPFLVSYDLCMALIRLWYGFGTALIRLWYGFAFFYCNAVTGGLFCRKKEKF
jgi:hypothetical protein